MKHGYPHTSAPWSVVRGHFQFVGKAHAPCAGHRKKKKGLGGSALSQGGAIATKRDDSWDGQSGPWIWTSPHGFGWSGRRAHGRAAPERQARIGDVVRAPCWFLALSLLIVKQRLKLYPSRSPQRQGRSKCQTGSLPNHRTCTCT